MSDLPRLRELLTQLAADGGGAGTRLNGAHRADLNTGFLRYLPGITGACVVLMTDVNVRAPLWVTDEVALRIDQLHFTLGEGPSTDAYGNGGPVLAADLATPEYAARWPVFTPEAIAAGVHAIFSFPLQVGAIRLGLLELYRDTAGGLSTAEIGDILQVCHVTTLALLDRQIDHKPGLEPGKLIEWAGELLPHRADVHQATGMLTVQLGIGPQEAFVRLRARAYAESRTVEEVARDIVERRLRLGGVGYHTSSPGPEPRQPAPPKDELGPDGEPEPNEDPPAPGEPVK
jgi:hypothetical protein